MTDTCAASPASVRHAPAAVSGRGGGGFSSQLTAGACSEKKPMPEKKMSDSVAVVVMILVQGPKQDSRRDYHLHTCDSTPRKTRHIRQHHLGTERGFRLRAFLPGRQTSKQQG